jgi:hypothetical protein
MPQNAKLSLRSDIKNNAQTTIMTEMKMTDKVKEEVNVNNDFLTQLKDSIERMQKVNQIEVLRILKKQNAKLNENKNGILVNLTYLPKELLKELCDYVKYVQEQEKIISMDEAQKNEFKTTYFH